MTGNISKTLMALVVTVLFVTLGACRSQRGATAPSPQRPESVVAQDWTDVEMPVRAELSAPTRFSASGKARMVNGQCIAISFRKIGFEVAYLYADSDSLYIIVKPLRVAYSESMRRIKEASGLSLGDVQSVLLGRKSVPEGLVRFSFDEPVETDGGTVYSDIEALAEVSGRRYAGGIRWNPGSSRWNCGISVERPAIPVSYQRIDTPALLRMLRSFSF